MRQQQGLRSASIRALLTRDQFRFTIPVLIRDRDVRFALHSLLIARHADDGTRIVDELALCQGETRVDVAVVNGELSGYEIKSAADTLARLPRQQELYSRILDRAWLVSTWARVGKLEHVLPSWWGLIAIDPSASAQPLREVRRAKLNRHVDPHSLAQLLWREECIELLRSKIPAARVSSKTRRFLWAALIESHTRTELREGVRAMLKKRPEAWRAGLVPP